jgi:hypothetical protein
MSVVRRLTAIRRSMAKGLIRASFRLSRARNRELSPTATDTGASSNLPEPSVARLVKFRVTIIINLTKSNVWSSAHKPTITNMVTMQNLEVISDKFNVYKICTYQV